MAGAEQTTPPRGPDEPAAASTAEDDRGYDVPVRPWVVHGAIIVAFGIFFSMVMLLFVRWAGSTDRNSTLVFRGNDRIGSVHVDLDGPRLDQGLTQILTEENGYEARFLVPAGSYLVRVSREGKPLAGETSVTVHEGVGQVFELSKALELTTRPTTAAATRPESL